LRFDVVIPARYASTRLPGKPLRLIAGSPMLQHVVWRAQESGADSVWVATDDERIRRAAEDCGARVCMTSGEHRSGTERIAEVVGRLGYADDALVVNLQGDEPLMPPELLRQVAEELSTHAEAAASTLAVPIESAEELFDPNAVKVVTDARGFALYFSRAPIPWHREAFAEGRRRLPQGVQWRRHLGLYAYRAGFLRAFAGWPASPLEQAESLEQLRAIWRGAAIWVGKAMRACPPGVDTEADLARVQAALSGALNVQP
jgi:3-deoxy-manno-octulosonate cytidylyltransferase (CMP-KDO synthetase)